MAVVIVGDPGCTFNDILSIVEGSPSFSVIANDWTRLALYFNTPFFLVENLKRKVLLDLLSTIDVIGNLLMDWVQRESRNATLNKLLHILRALQWNQLADSLKHLATPEDR